MASACDSEDSVTCPVCCDVPVSPVTIPCGHSFCRGCIRQYWDVSDVPSCPLCQRCFLQRPEVDSEPAALSHGSGHGATDQGESRKGRCKVHHSRLSLFCLDDKSLLCTLCAAIGHQKHKVVEADKQIPKIKEQVSVEVLMRKSHASKMKGEILHATAMLDAFKASAGSQKDEIERDFDRLRDSITRYQRELMSAVEQKERVILQEAKSAVEEKERECNAFETSISRMDVAMRRDDPEDLVKLFKTLSMEPGKPSEEVLTLDPSMKLVNRRKLIEGLENAFHMELQGLWEGFSSKETVACQDINYHSKILNQYRTELVLDPDTAGCYIWVDPGCLRAFNTHPFAQPRKSVRYTKDSRVRGTRGYSMGRHFWKVTFSSDTKVIEHPEASYQVGLMCMSVSGSAAESWCLEVLPKAPFLRVHSSEGTSLCGGRRRCEGEIGMYLDYELGVIAFFDMYRSIQTLLYTIRSEFTEPLYPVFDIAPGYRLKSSQ